MGRLLDISIEPLSPAGAPRCLRCGALPGRPSHVRGAPIRLDADRVACEVWLDDQSQRASVFRPEGAGPLSLVRGGRFIEVAALAPVPLQDQDELAFAGRRLRVHLYYESAREAATTLELEDPTYRDRSEASTVPIDVRGLPSDLVPPLEPDRSGGRLVVTLYDGQRTRDIDLGAEVTIGSVRGNHLVLPGRGVERRHARIVRGPSGEVTLIDQHTESGTLVNGRRVRGPTTLHEQDTINIGEFVLRVRWKPLA